MLTTTETALPADDPWVGCNPFDPAFRDDPYPSLARLRALDPVNEMPVGIWRLTRYADVNRLLHDVPETVHVGVARDRKSTRLNSSHVAISYAVFCLKKKTKT